MLVLWVWGLSLLTLFQEGSRIPSRKAAGAEMGLRNQPPSVEDELHQKSMYSSPAILRWSCALSLMCLSGRYPCASLGLRPSHLLYTILPTCAHIPYPCTYDPPIYTPDTPVRRYPPTVLLHLFTYHPPNHTLVHTHGHIIYPAFSVYTQLAYSPTCLTPKLSP